MNSMQQNHGHVQMVRSVDGRSGTISSMGLFLERMQLLTRKYVKTGIRQN